MAGKKKAPPKKQEAAQQQQEQKKEKQVESYEAKAMEQQIVKQISDSMTSAFGTWHDTLARPRSTAARGRKPRREVHRSTRRCQRSIVPILERVFRKSSG